MERRVRFSGMVFPVLAVLAAGVAEGAGFSLYEQGARGLGAGGAYVARVGDPSAVFFNPAGLGRMEGGMVIGGASLLFVSREFAGADPYPGAGVSETGPDQVFFVPHAYWGRRVSSDLAVGFGVYAPFGLTTEWENEAEFTGRFISTRASLKPFYFSPAAALDLGPRLRVGAALVAVHSSLELHRHVARPNPSGSDPGILDLGTVELAGDNGLDFGVNFGVQMDAGGGVILGAVYRGGIGVDYEGDADFTFEGTGTALDPQLALLFPEDQTVATDIEFPTVIVGGLAWESSSGSWALEGDVGWTQWSSFDRLRFGFEDPDLVTVLDETWEDAFFYRAGAEYRMNPRTQLRVGVYYDETPQPTESVSPILPDNNRVGLTAGFGKNWGDWSADLFGLILLAGDRTTDGVNRDGYEGAYANSANIFGLTVSWSY